MTGLGRRLPLFCLALLLPALLLGGCLDISALQDVRPQVADRPVTTSTGKGDFLSRLDRAELRVIEENGGVYDDARLSALIGRIVERLAAASGRPDLRYRVTILNSPAVNAFALSNSRLYVTRGLLALANDESELGAVLSHEMAHVTAGHAAVRADMARSLAGQLTGSRTGAPASARLNADMASFSQAQEMEADRMGATVAWRAGFDPYGTVRFLDALGRNESLIQSANHQGASRDFSHPATADRLRAALADAELRGASSAGERDRDLYLASIAGLLFGADLNEGIVRGRQFLQPRLGFSFTAPAGMVLQKLHQGAVGAEPSGTNAMRLDVVNVPAEMTPAEYLASGATENVEAASLRELTIDGRPAATATARMGGWTLRLFTVRFGREVCRLVFAARELSPELDQAFAEAANTIRAMSSAERRSAQPLRLRIHTVRPGDTAESLAAGMATGRPVERFLLLNGLRAGEPLHPGDRVKIVSGDDMG